MKYTRLNSIEEFNKINRDSLCEQLAQPKYFSNFAINSTNSNSFEELFTTVNHFGAGNSDEDKIFQNFFNQF